MFHQQFSATGNNASHGAKNVSLCNVSFLTVQVRHPEELEKRSFEKEDFRIEKCYGQIAFELKREN